MEVLYIFLIWLSSYTLGRSFLSIIKIRISKEIYDLTSLSLGWAILSFYLLLLAGLHLLTKEVVLFSIIFLSLISIYLLKGRFKSLRWKISYQNNRVNILLIAIIIWLSVFNLFDVFAPPSVADSLMYHFSIPLLYIEENGFFYNPFFHYNAPHLLETFSIIGFILNSENLVHLQYYSFNFLILWLFLAFSKKHLNSYHLGLFAFALYFVTPMATDLKSAGYVEIGLSLVTLFSIWMLIESLQNQTIDKNYFILSAIFLGIALSIKYYGLFSGVITFLVIISYLFYNKFSIQKSIKYLLLYAFFVVLFGSMFYVLNYIHTGNPLYPAMYNIFGGKDYSLELNTVMKEMTSFDKRPAGEDLTGFITSLWYITMEGDKFLAGRNGYGPLLLLLPLFLIPLSNQISNETKKFIKISSIYMVGVWILWYLLAIQRTRHLLPMLMLLTLVFSIYLHDLKKNNFYNNFILKQTLSFFFILFFGFGFVVNFIFTKQFIPVTIGKIDRNTFLDQKLPYYKGVIWANENLPKGSKIFNYIGNRTYYIKHKSYYASPYFQGKYDFTQIKDVNLFYQKLKQDGFTHIMSNVQVYDIENETDPFLKNYFTMYNKITNKYCVLLQIVESKSLVTRTSNNVQINQTFIYEIR